MKRLAALLLCASLLLALCPVFRAEAADQPDVKIAAFTFDDGPTRTITPKLLDALAERDVHVTFFVNGANAEHNPDIVLRAASEGHQIANHTYAHKQLTALNDANVVYEVSRTQNYLCELLGQNDYLVRVPYGASSDRVRGLVSYPFIFWSVDPTNGKVTPAGKMRDGIVKAAHDGAIILMHDTSTSNLEGSIAAIDILLQRGYVFVTLDELFRLKGVTPQNYTSYYKVTGETHGYVTEAQLSEHWAYESIQYVKSTGLMVGDDNGLFRPNSTITRAEAAAILWRFAGSPRPVSLTSGFYDVQLGTWYSDAVAWARETNTVYGVTETKFCPNDRITKEAFYTMFENFLRAQGYTQGGVFTQAQYIDNNGIAEWSMPYVNAILSRGFTTREDTGNHFFPKRGLTRAEAAELLEWACTLPAPGSTEIIAEPDTETPSDTSEEASPPPLVIVQ